MSAIHLMCCSTGSTDSAMTLTLRFLNSPPSLAVMPSSVVQTGVKSAGCEYSTPQLSPSHWWKWMGPSLDCCSKSGAMSPRRSVMAVLLGWRRLRGGQDSEAGQSSHRDRQRQRREAHDHARQIIWGDG